ncbi:MAG: hypothetical protein ABR552_01355 [Actinomycetota bacterium]|nr:hypothetical protein [Actinomycetota bacterium]
MSRIPFARALLSSSVLCALLIPMPARAASCPKVFVDSGFAAPIASDVARAGANPGQAGSDCLSPVAIPQTFYLVPGATHAWAGVTCTGVKDPPTATMSVTAGAHTTVVSLVFNQMTCVRSDLLPSDIGRWESNSVPLPANTTKVAVTWGDVTVKYCAVTAPNC